MTTSHPNRPPRVVVGVDGSESSKRALAWAAYIAESTGAVVEAVTSWMFPLSYGWAVALTESPADSMEKVLTETVDEIFGPQRPDDMRLIIREGHAAKVLLEVSEGAVMLVVGSRGHGGFAGLLLGSVSASVAEHATCPVLVVHGDHLPPKGSA